MIILALGYINSKMYNYKKREKKKKQNKTGDQFQAFYVDHVLKLFIVHFNSRIKAVTHELDISMSPFKYILVHYAFAM